MAPSGGFQPPTSASGSKIELVKKPRDLLEYVIVHILEPTHSARFTKLLSDLYPNWAEARRELNELPIPSI